MNLKRWRVLAILLVAFALVAASCGGDDDSDDSTDTTVAAQPDADPLKVAFVHVGPVVEITTLESIPEGSDAQRVFEDLAAQGNKLIFGTSFGYMDPMLAAAENFPDTVFMHATGFKVSENMGNYFGAAEEGRYLSGMAAGAATTTNLIGYVAAFPIPEVLRGINAFTLGAQEVNPDAEVQVVWTSTRNASGLRGSRSGC